MNLFNTKCLAVKYLQLYVYVHNKYECEKMKRANMIKCVFSGKVSRTFHHELPIVYK